MKEKSLIFWFLLAMAGFAQDDLRGQLLNYDFQRLKISISARSMLIDLVRNENYDSARTIINFCDSINYPDSSWLSNRERFLMHFLAPDTGYLLTKNVYTEVLGLSDTVPPYHHFYYYNVEQMYSYRLMQEKVRFVQGNFPGAGLNYTLENVGHILYLLAKERLGDLRGAYPAQGDLWDFLELVFNFEERPRDSISVAANRFLSNYSESKFRDLVAYNFTDNFKKSAHGFSAIIKLRYDDYPDETNAWIKDHPTFSFEAGYIYRGISISGNFAITTAGTNSSLVNVTDTLPDTVGVNPIRFQTLLGYTFFLPAEFIITPGVAFDVFTVGAQGKKYEDFEIPTTVGGGLYITVEKGIMWNPTLYAGRVLNFRAGAVYNDFRRIRKDLGNWSLFFETGYGWKGFGRSRDYSH